MITDDILKAFDDIADIGLILIDKSLSIINVNDYILRNFSEFDEIDSNTLYLWLDNFDYREEKLKKDIFGYIEKVFSDNIPFLNIYLERLQERLIKRFKLNIKPLDFFGGNYVLLSIIKISEKKPQEEGVLPSGAMSEHALRLKGYTEDSFCGVFIVDEEGRMLSCNGAMCDTTGYSRAELMKKRLYDIFQPSYHTYLKNSLAYARETGSATIEAIYLEGSGRGRHCRIDVVRISHGEYLCLKKDVTEIAGIQKKIINYIFHDHITGFYNRRYMTNFLARFVENKSIYPFSIILGDINGLKVVNDAFGRKAGDSVIKRIADIIKGTCSPTDILGKWGGDEFIIISPNSTQGYAQEVIRKIKERCGRDDHSIKLSISFGHATKRSEYDNLEDVFKQAEGLMVKNKIYEGASFRSQAIHLIINTLNEKNKREEQHSIRVSRICLEIGKAKGLSQSDLNKLRVIGLLHDIGKIGISEHILNKAGNLNEEECKEMKKHSEIGYRILSSSNQTSELAQDVLDHHERMDGQGYPNGKRGRHLSLTTRILSVADAYDAMTSERPYRKVFSKEEAIEELLKNSGTQFDANIVELFISKVLNNPHSEIDNLKSPRREAVEKIDYCYFEQ
jgi:diguanylate cyclase (GGDEF)-like protein/PAS domain S-box-containing protein